MSETLQTVNLSDYQVPDYSVDRVELAFDLREENTIVRSELAIRRNNPGPLVLNGEDLTLLFISVDGNELSLTFRDSPPFKQAILHGYPLGPSANPEGTPMADLFKNQICSSEVSPSQSGVAGTQNSVSSSPFG